MTTSRGFMALALSPLAVLLASGTRLIIISDFDTTTATTMATSGKLGETILGTVIPLLPIFLPAALVVLAIFRQWPLLIFAGLATALLTPAYATVDQGWDEAFPQLQDVLDLALKGQWDVLWQDWRILVYCAVLGFAFSLWDSFQEGGFGPPRGLLVAGISALTLLFILNVYRPNYNLDTISEALRRPWLPAEVIELKSGEVRVGYILSTERPWQTVLDDKTRAISYVRVDEIVNRTVCRAERPPADDAPSPLVRLKAVPPTPTSEWCDDERLAVLSTPARPGRPSS